MPKEKLISKDYVFKAGKNGKLSFVGDFEGLYKNEADPWGQRGADARLGDYYAFSRTNLVNAVKSVTGVLRKNTDILEVGCGFGYVSAELQKGLFEKGKVTGMDISHTAVTKAKTLFPDLEFIAGDICSKKLKIKGKFDVVIMSQILWYILEKLPYVFENIDNLLRKDGYLIFVNAFLKEQKYGKNIIDGFDGLARHVLVSYPGKYRLISAQIDYSGRFLHYDGILIFKKGENNE
jgi:SAM-dependent methyltransferase